ncbi:hypothetical protein B0A67_18975 [Flavobacterium aquidurense]|uniref:DUF4468 domain-containing protein n=1 Tax=Flavobacterium aquidurense TaxID=362413 RepID=UPI000922B0CC|nr:DUF4468 domain-containing protein [Flavobacterium aquidurense]OXA69794.1 hypothetical protein B0A67_18975 [Flavobacterium aquidurense]SHH25636.1 protein of unknown function [Flavobacterium frigidimaris]
MKRLLLCVFLICNAFVFAQSKKEMLAEMDGKYNVDDNNNVTITKIIEIDGLKKEEIYPRVLAYFTYNYGNGESVIQVQEKENGLIIGKGIYDNVHVGYSIVTTEIDLWHVIRVDIKDNKVRVFITLTEYKTKTMGGNTAPSYSTLKVFDSYPINPKGWQSTIYTKALYKSTKMAYKSIESIEKSIKEGNTNSTENNGW